MAGVTDEIIRFAARNMHRRWVAAVMGRAGRGVDYFPMSRLPVVDVVDFGDVVDVVDIVDGGTTAGIDDAVAAAVVDVVAAGAVVVVVGGAVVVVVGAGRGWSPEGPPIAASGRKSRNSFRASSVR